MDKVVHFEIHFDDEKRALDFYKKVFGWEIQSIPEMSYNIVRTAETDEKTRMIKEVGAINGGMMKRDDSIKSPVITIDVKSVDESLEMIEKSGGKILKAKIAVGDMGFVGYFQDTEGNVLGLWETAKKS